MSSILIGINTGIDMTDQDGYVIIGDNILLSDFEKKDKADTIFFGEKVAIGKTISGQYCNLYDLLINSHR